MACMNAAVCKRLSTGTKNTSNTESNLIIVQTYILARENIFGIFRTAHQYNVLPQTIIRNVYLS